MLFSATKDMEQASQAWWDSQHLWVKERESGVQGQPRYLESLRAMRHCAPHHHFHLPKKGRKKWAVKRQVWSWTHVNPSLGWWRQEDQGLSQPVLCSETLSQTQEKKKKKDRRVGREREERRKGHQAVTSHEGALHTLMKHPWLSSWYQIIPSYYHCNSEHLEERKPLVPWEGKGTDRDLRKEGWQWQVTQVVTGVIHICQKDHRMYKWMWNLGACNGPCKFIHYHNHTPFCCGVWFREMLYGKFCLSDPILLFLF